MITSIKLFRRTILKVISSRNNKHSKIYPKKTQMRHLLWQNLKAVGFLSLNSTWVNCNQNTNNLKKYTQIFKRMKKSQGDSVPSLTATNVNFQSLTTYSSTCPKSKRVTLRPRLELPSQSLLMIPLIRRNLPIKLTVYWVSTTAGSLLIMNILASRLPKLSKIQIQSSESVWNQLGWGLRWIIRLISSVTKNTISSYPLPKNNSRRQIMRAITNSKISQSIKYLILNETAIVLEKYAPQFDPCWWAGSWILPSTAQWLVSAGHAPRRYAEPVSWPWSAFPAFAHWDDQPYHWLTHSWAQLWTLARRNPSEAGGANWVSIQNQFLDREQLSRQSLFTESFNHPAW